MTVVIGLLILIFLILFHETGHFIFARLCGIKVEAFSVGMGPVLLHHTSKSGTDWRISLIPIGGYCAMKGEKDFADAVEQNLPCIDSAPDTFYGTHPLKRLLTAFGGPLFNLILGIAAFTATAMIGYTYYSADTSVSVIEEFEGEESPAKKAELKTGDIILELDGNPAESFADVAAYIAEKPLEQIEVKVLRGDEEKVLYVTPALDKTNGTGKIGIMSDSSSLKEIKKEGLSFFPALKEGFVRSVNCIVLTLKGLRNLFRGVDVSSALSGPIRITTFVGDAVSDGFEAGFRSGVIMILELLALISVSLFFTNMLPVSIFDGGLILIAAAEWILHRKLKPKLMLYIQYAGLAVVLLLMIFVIGNDIIYLIKK